MARARRSNRSRALSCHRSLHTLAELPVAVLWDISYLLDTASRITQGQLPYRDFPFAHAPLTFLVHAELIRLFGRAYLPHILCAALEAGLATVLTWRLLLRQLQPLADRDLIATLLAAPLIVLGIYGIYPHPIYDSDCILAILLSLTLLQHADESASRNFLAGIACILPLFLKQNIGLPFLLITLAIVAGIAIIRHQQRLSLTPQLWIIAGASTALAAALLLIQITVGLHNYLYWTVTFAAQRRLPGLSLIIATYHQASLLWTLPTSLFAFALLHGGKWVPHPFHGFYGTIRSRYRSFTIISVLLLVAPFLWIIASLAFTSDRGDRADQFLSLWPHLLILSAILAATNLRPRIWLRSPTLTPLLPLILLVTIHGTFLSQQLWGSTYALWPLLTLLIAALLTQVPAIARPIAAITSTTLLICGSLYATSHERLSYIHLEGRTAHATLPQLQGLATPGPYIPAFEELVRVTNAEIPPTDAILLIPGENPFFFVTGRAPQFPILLFDPATDPYTPHQTLAQSRAHNVRWLIVTHDTQLTAPPSPDIPEVLRTLLPDFVPYRTLTNYDIYRRK